MSIISIFLGTIVFMSIQASENNRDTTTCEQYTSKQKLFTFGSELENVVLDKKFS